MTTAALSHFACVPGRAGQASLRQHDVRVFDSGRTLVVASAFAMPRLWGYSLDAALAGFGEGLARTSDGTVTSRLHQALEEARKTLRARVEVLLERRPPDVGILAVSVDGNRLHVLCCGPGRVFVRHRQKMRRLTPREDRAEGLLKATPAWCVEAIEPGDLVVAGSLSACGQHSLHTMHAALGADPGLAPERVVAILNAEAASRAIGAASVAVRIAARRTVI